VARAVVLFLKVLFNDVQDTTKLHGVLKKLHIIT